MSKSISHTTLLSIFSLHDGKWTAAAAGEAEKTTCICMHFDWIATIHVFLPIRPNFLRKIHMTHKLFCGRIISFRFGIAMLEGSVSSYLMKCSHPFLLCNLKLLLNYVIKIGRFTHLTKFADEQVDFSNTEQRTRKKETDRTTWRWKYYRINFFLRYGFSTLN